MEIASPDFYLGSPPAWLWNGKMDGFRLFPSYRQLAGRKSAYPAATVPEWVQDSGSFTYFRDFGRCPVSPAEYARDTARIKREAGRMKWAAGQDHMCEEPVIYGGTWNGLRFAGTRQFIDPRSRMSYEQIVRVHQELTVGNCIDLENAWPQFSDDECPYRPTLQGRVGDPESYLECAAMYEAAGIRLADYPVVGVGSVCRLQSDKAISRLAAGLVPLGLNLHWFGLKVTGLPHVWPHMLSHDSHAWSAEARREPRLDGCTHIRVRGKYTGQPSTCANCPRKAQQWARKVIALGGSIAHRGYQPGLFDDVLAGAA